MERRIVTLIDVEFYYLQELLEIMMIELFPEIRQLKPKQKPIPTVQKIMKE